MIPRAPNHADYKPNANRPGDANHLGILALARDFNNDRAEM